MKLTDRNKKYILLGVIIAAVLSVVIMSGFTGCASIERSCKDCKSEVQGGLNRTVNVYAYDGTLIASYTGRIDIEENDTKVLFELDGKRYVYYNAIVEVIEN